MPSLATAGGGGTWALQPLVHASRLQGIVSKVEQRAENAERLFLEAEEAAHATTDA